MADKIKKLSQAIRLGATFRPQCRRHLFRLVHVNGLGTEIGSCALGAAGEALGFQVDCGPKAGFVAKILDRFGLPLSLADDIAERNDGTNGHSPKTREQIADWLEAQGL